MKAAVHRHGGLSLSDGLHLRTGQRANLFQGTKRHACQTKKCFVLTFWPHSISSDPFEYVSNSRHRAKALVTYFHAGEKLCVGTRPCPHGPTVKPQGRDGSRGPLIPHQTEKIHSLTFPSGSSQCVSVIHAAHSSSLVLYCLKASLINTVNHLLENFHVK